MGTARSTAVASFFSCVTFYSYQIPALPETEAISFESDGSFNSTLDDAQPRSGKYRTGRDRIILLDEQEPDRELALIILDYTPTRLVAFDETIESDRRLVRCR